MTDDTTVTEISVLASVEEHAAYMTQAAKQAALDPTGTGWEFYERTVALALQSSNEDGMFKARNHIAEKLLDEPVCPCKCCHRWRERIIDVACPVIREASTPALFAAMRLIDEDSGRHLIGTVYPGEPQKPEYPIPPAWQHLVQPAEEALSMLRLLSSQAYEDFVAGPEHEQSAVLAQYPALKPAHRLLNDWFNGWQNEDRPQPEESTSDQENAADS